MDNILIIVIAIAAFFLFGCKCNGSKSENFCSPVDVPYGIAKDQTGSNLSGTDDLSIADKKTIIEHRVKSKGIQPNSTDFNSNCGVPLIKYKKKKKSKAKKEGDCKKCKDAKAKKKETERFSDTNNFHLGMNEDLENYAAL
jgi:hypothetical protein